MSATELRKAAETLRARAASATQGPWVQAIDGFYGPQAFVASPDGDQPGAISGAPTSAYRGAENAAYIATMHPGVGLALADWLDERAEDYVGKADECLKVARLINGEV